MAARSNGYPLAFFTEASLDLAEDDELMRLMAEAGMVAVFIGIESPDEDALRETKKFQNVRGRASSTASTRSRTPAWRSTPG